MDVIITTIFPPTRGMQLLSKELLNRGGRLWVMGDRSGPKSYDLPTVRFYDIETQKRLPFRLACLLPEKHYTRKNLGYLLAIQNGAETVIETDDDNIPLPLFWEQRNPMLMAHAINHNGWFNAYREYSSSRIWPRGFPLEHINSSFEDRPKIDKSLSLQECLIQQGLANQNPDVDAVFRLTSPLPIMFENNPPLALNKYCWCPFNSQNTTFFKSAFPLLYLPTFCTFRMTDIWRSFVAQRCLWEMESKLGFTNATVYQERNEHNLLRDFEQEIPGYLNNNRIRELLENTSLRSGRSCEIVRENLITCYESLVKGGILSAQELPLIEAWNRDLSTLT